MSTQEITSTNNLQELSNSEKKDQYTLWQIIGVWLAAGAPMWLLGWVVYPAMSTSLTAVDAGLLRMKLLTLGMVWQFLLAMIVPIAREFDVKAASDLTIGGEAVVADAQGDNVNLRDQPSYAGNVLTSVPEGGSVTVIDGPFTDDTDGTIWYQVSTGDQTGYMLSDYLSAADESVSAAAVMTTTANVNFRTGPGTSYSVILVIPNGSTVNTTGAVQNGFTRLTYGGSTGWVVTQQRLRCR